MSKTIVREGYHRKAYTRSAYVRADGTKVAATKVAAAWVPPARVPAKGMALVTGHKGKKLIDMKDYRHLRNYGYDFEEGVAPRKKALQKAIGVNGYLWTIHRLNALRTLSKNTMHGVHNKADHDLKHIEAEYKHYKQHHAREHRTR
jgi:hypothetical protein